MLFLIPAVCIAGCVFFVFFGEARLIWRIIVAALVVGAFLLPRLGSPYDLWATVAQGALGAFFLVYIKYVTM